MSIYNYYPAALTIYEYLRPTCRGGYTLVTLPRIVTPYRDSVDRNRDRVTYQKFDYAVTLGPCVFGRRIKGMIWLRPEKVWTCNGVARPHLLRP